MAYSAAAAVVALIGPSGCGKSTLLNLASGLDRPSRGRVYVDGAEVTGPNSHVAFMLQRDLLLPWRSILDNVTFGQEIQHVGKERRREVALKLLAKYHLSEFVGHYDVFHGVWQIDLFVLYLLVEIAFRIEVVDRHPDGLSEVAEAFVDRILHLLALLTNLFSSALVGPPVQRQHQHDRQQQK